MTSPNWQSDSRNRAFLAAILVVVNLGLLGLNLAKQDVLPFSLGLFDDDDAAGEGTTDAAQGSIVPGETTIVADTTPASPEVTAGDAAVTSSTLPSTTIDDWPGGQGPVPEGPPVPRRAIFTSAGRLELTGSAPDWATATKILQFAAEKLPGGPDQIDNFMTWHPNASGDTQSGDVVMEQAATFAIGSTDIDPASFPSLDLIAQILVERPTVFTVVIGHTDDSGDEQANAELAFSRAEAVVGYLIEKGANPGQLVVAAAGEDNPLEDNATVEGREANRRIEVQLKNFLIADPTFGGSG